MNEISLDEILAAAHDAEFSQYDNVPEHVFSRRHNRAMRRIFRAYEKQAALHNGIARGKSAGKRFVWNRKTVLIVLTLIFLAVLAGCSAIIYSLGGFRAEGHTDNTQLFPLALADCPQRIEEVYYLSELPSEFELLEESVSDISVYTAYINSATGKTITFHQSIKTAFEPRFNTERSALEEISIAENKGIGLEGRTGYAVAWDNGDYILEIWADLPKAETINLAKSAKVL